MNDNSLVPDVREHPSVYYTSLPAHAPVSWATLCPTRGERKHLDGLTLHTTGPCRCAWQHKRLAQAMKNHRQ
jgi:hypothetical protein